MLKQGATTRIEEYLRQRIFSNCLALTGKTQANMLSNVLKASRLFSTASTQGICCSGIQTSAGHAQQSKNKSAIVSSPPCPLSGNVIQRHRKPAKVYHTCQRFGSSYVKQTRETEDIPYPLTDDEALYFLENILKISQPLKLLKKDRVEFLNVFLFQMNTYIPFNNIQFVGRVFDKDYSLTFSEGKMAMFAQQGSTCLTINLFTKAILDSLGYKAFHIGANNPGDITFDSHVSIIICDLTFQGSLHLVDPGMTRPFYEAIPLDFSEESKIYQFNYLKCKLFKGDHGVVHLCTFIPEGQTATSPTVIESKGMSWKIQISYRPHLKRSREYFYQKMNKILGFPSIMPDVFRSIGIITRRDGRSFHLMYQDDLFSLRYMHKDPSQCEVFVLTKEEFINFMEKEFPQFPRSLVEKAVQNKILFNNLYGI
ncbi:hypothetical protein HOLleu_40746 [Holothuria leucospilota]|uniref:Arylamine N-acetyltransferase n=1 Tax=Holothuria leucospilota TaxID=206669 RepID=A0A9Q0YIP2_HOLLE|nr:hypothetical protein HOLleu_40746 [Holothuria leucospilota]